MATRKSWCAPWCHLTCCRTETFLSESPLTLSFMPTDFQWSVSESSAAAESAFSSSQD